MFVNYRTQGFILKKVDRGETDQMLTIYTKDFGKLEILAKAVRKISSKLRPGAEIFYLSEIEFIQAKTHKTLTDALSIEKFENLREDLRKLKIAYKIAEVFDELVKGQEKDEKIWQLLSKTFDKLNTKYKIQDTGYKIYYYFFWNLLSLLGYEPELYNCVLCRQKIRPGNVFFSAKEGGVICQNHVKLLKLAKEIEPETIKILRIILKRDLPLLFRLKMEKSHLKSLSYVTSAYLSYVREIF
jgi:DNA repair protein RecO (recombination protein O)